MGMLFSTLGYIVLASAQSMDMDMPMGTSTTMSSSSSSSSSSMSGMTSMASTMTMDHSTMTMDHSTMTGMSGMDMSGMDDMDMYGMDDMDMSGMSMTFHVSYTDPLFFSGWVPNSAGAYAGTILFIIALGIVWRMTAGWKTQYERKLRENHLINAWI